MALLPIEARCESCNTTFTGQPKRSFLGFQKINCSSCGQTLGYPLTSGYRSIYWGLFVLMILGFLYRVSIGELRPPSFMGIIAIFVLLRDMRIRNKLPKSIFTVPLKEIFQLPQSRVQFGFLFVLLIGIAITYSLYSTYVTTGNLTKYYSNGQKQSELTQVNGVANGLHTEWYENGQLRYQGNLVNGIEQGKHSEWFENGQKEAEINYLNGQMHGKQIEWYENGRKKTEVDYVNGVMQGKFTSWFEDGRKQAEAIMDKGEVVGSGQLP